jgi:putative aldouronate transport system permease protein
MRKAGNVRIGHVLFQLFNHIYLVLISLAMSIPFLIILSTSFSSETSITVHGYGLFPREFSLSAFKFIFNAGTMLDGYMISVIITVIGTVLAVTITTMAAYAISRKDLKYRNFFALAFYFTMIFNGGLVPFYIIVSKLGIRNTIWALIIPMCFNPFNMLLMRNFFQTQPVSLIESAKLDGAGELQIFLKIMLPISLPGLATITLFYLLGYWNDWWLSLLFIDDTKLFPLQFLLRKVLSNVSFAASGMAITFNIAEIPMETVKMATCVMAVGPIVLVYPFIQRYFIKGITIGAVKG